MRRRLAMAAALLAVLGGLWYLRDPAWLVDQTTGLRGWERGADGVPFRWAGGHASFFVPSDARAVRVPVATTFDAARPRGDEPMVVTFTIDDEKGTRILLSDPGWQQVSLTMPPPGGRRVRRVDVRTEPTREDNHGVRIGELQVTLDGREWQPCCFSPR